MRVLLALSLLNFLIQTDDFLQSCCTGGYLFIEREFSAETIYIAHFKWENLIRMQDVSTPISWVFFKCCGTNLLIDWLITFHTTLLPRGCERSFGLLSLTTVVVLNTRDIIQPCCFKQVILLWFLRLQMRHFYSLRNHQQQ